MKDRSEQHISLRCIDANDETNPLNGRILNLTIWKYSENGGNFLASSYSQSVMYFAYKNGSTFNGWYSFSDDETLTSDIFSGIAINSGDDLNDYTTPGIYNSNTSAVTASLLNMPEIFGSGFLMLVLPISSASSVQVIYAGGGGGTIYTRSSNTSGWQAWYKYSGTEIKQ